MSNVTTNTGFKDSAASAIQGFLEQIKAHLLWAILI